jgi:hypothetical protein
VDQYLLFRETDETSGHHIAMYVGETVADFERAVQNCMAANVIWVNPRFSDKATNVKTDQQWKQFRFKDTIDMETGERIMGLEHEMRSIQHEACRVSNSKIADKDNVFV